MFNLLVCFSEDKKTYLASLWQVTGTWGQAFIFLKYREDSMRNEGLYFHPMDVLAGLAVCHSLEFVQICLFANCLDTVAQPKLI